MAHPPVVYGHVWGWDARLARKPYPATAGQQTGVYGRHNGWRDRRLSTVTGHPRVTSSQWRISTILPPVRCWRQSSEGPAVRHTQTGLVLGAYPNTPLQPRLEAGAERRLSSVGCR
jgi:hypothetical protein